MMKISPVESLDICGLSLLSQAKLAGREQLLVQAPLLALIIIFTAAVVLVLGPADWPLLNAATERRIHPVVNGPYFLLETLAVAGTKIVFHLV